FKGMSYNDIRQIFEKVWDFNQNIEPIDTEHGSEKQKSLAKEKSPEKVVEEEIDTQKELKESVKEPGAKLYRLVKNSGIHILLMENGLAIHMLTEKKYPLSQEMISKMLKKKLEVDHESSQAIELLRFIRSQVQK
ncbi:hypothetical protein Tco_1061909, partial [Tanacetum coccineum]